MYSIKEMFYTLQGEGVHAGRPAVFCRFSGCNLWSGREIDRAKAACTFCDTYFVGTDGQNGGQFKTAAELAKQIASHWPINKGRRFVVFTGGEPALQLTHELIATLHAIDFECAVETNGTLALPDNLDWVCISPKGHSAVIHTHCDELKLVYPQMNNLPENFDHIQATQRFLSPLNPWSEPSLIPTQHDSTQQCIDYCLENPKWSLTLQTHKILNID